MDYRKMVEAKRDKLTDDQRQVFEILCSSYCTRNKNEREFFEPYIENGILCAKVYSAHHYYLCNSKKEVDEDKYEFDDLKDVVIRYVADEEGLLNEDIYEHSGDTEDFCRDVYGYRGTFVLETRKPSMHRGWDFNGGVTLPWGAFESKEMWDFIKKVKIVW